MNKKCTKMILAIVAIAGLTAPYSCRKSGPAVAQQEGSEPVPEGQEVIQKNGWLYFTDMSSFEATMAKLHAAEGDDGLIAWEKSYKQFTSWRTASRQELLEDKPNEQRMDIPDPLLTTVLSSEGRIQIADTVYQLSMEKKEPLLFAVPKNHEADLLKGTDPAGLSGVIAHKIGLHLMPYFPTWQDNDRVVTPYPVSDICNFPDQILFPWWGQKGGLLYHANNGDELYQDNGRQVRIDYHRWRVGFLFYSSVGVRVKLYKHTRLGGWMSNIKMNRVSLQACSKGLIVVPGLLPVPYNAEASASASNTNSLERNLKWVVAPMHIEVVPHHFNFNFTVDYRGQQVSRYIRE